MSNKRSECCKACGRTEKETSFYKGFWSYCKQCHSSRVSEAQKVRNSGHKVTVHKIKKMNLKPKVFNRIVKLWKIRVAFQEWCATGEFKGIK